MTDTTLTHSDLDWNELWQNARQKKGWKSKGAGDWDKKSAAFAARNTTSVYAELLIAQLPLEPAMTVLDVGSGPGTLALPLATRCKSVTAIDYSSGMLDILRQQARAENLGNITTMKCAWEDDWQELAIEKHDIAIASRSMNVADLPAAIAKLNSHARRYVFLAERISPTPFDPEAFAAVGRSFDSGPDYIYTINMLYTMGIHPNITILALEPETTFSDFDQAMQSYSWMIKDITAEEEDKLHHYILGIARKNNNGSLTIQRQSPPRWALIWWQNMTDHHV